MEDSSERLLEALEALRAVIDEVTPDEAAGVLEEATLQVFWREWPDLSSWGGAVWRRLNDDLAAPATPHSGSDLDEVGGESGG